MEAMFTKFTTERMSLTRTRRSLEPKSSLPQTKRFHPQLPAHYSDEMRDRKKVYDSDESADDQTPNCSRLDEGCLLPPNVVSFYRTPGVSKYRRRMSVQPAIDYLSELQVPDECILHIFRNLNKRDLVNAMKSTSRFYAIGQTSELWQSVDLSNRSVRISHIHRILRRGCKVLRLCGSNIVDDSNESCDDLPESIRLTHLDLSRSEVPLHFIETVLAACKQLQCISLEGSAVSEAVFCHLSQNKYLTHLDLSMVRGLVAEHLRLVLEGCRRLLELNVSWCNLDEFGVMYVCNILTPSILRLNLSGTLDKQAVRDQFVCQLVERCDHLIELDLSDSPLLTKDSLEKILACLPHLETLSLSRCFGIHPVTFLQCVSVRRLNIFGCVTEEGEVTLRSRLAHTHINHSPFSHVARPTPPPSVTSIWGMKTKDLY